MGSLCLARFSRLLAAWMPLNACINLAISVVGGGGRPSRTCSWRTPDRYTLIMLTVMSFNAKYATNLHKVKCSVADTSLCIC